MQWIRELLFLEHVQAELVELRLTYKMTGIRIIRVKSHAGELFADHVMLFILENECESGSTKGIYKNLSLL